MKKLNTMTAGFLSVLMITTCIITATATTYYYSSGFELYHDENTEGWIVNSCSLENSEISVPPYLLDEPITTIGGRSFENKTDLTFVYIPDTVTDIGAYAFSGCSSLSTILFSENLQNIYMGAFRSCNSLMKLDLSNTNIALIDSAAFYRCGELKEVILPDTVEIICTNAFGNCPKLKKITIDRQVTTIEEGAFDGSPNTVIYCYFDSTAYYYAKENNMPYVLLDNIILGDVNSDGYVNINDVTAIQRHLAELESLNELQELAADANRDGFVDISDATAIQMFLAEYEIPYPIGEVITQ